MAKRLLITSTDLMMVQFLVPHVIHLSQNGFEVEIACSDVGGRMDEIRQKLEGFVRAVHTVRLKRSPISPVNFQGYRDMKKLLDSRKYDLIWTNEPVMGVVTRLAAQKARSQGTKVIYMVHGFHFYKGAPLLNWLVYYPIEKWMAPKADMIVTINREDYEQAGKFNVARAEYIHGIGINTERLSTEGVRGDIRQELHLAQDDFIVLSVGELNKNKNQQTILQALAILNDPKIHYILCGKGDQLTALQQLSAELKLEDRVHFLGYRTDVVDICSRADVFAMPSRREGLPVASLEAMYCGLPLITSNIRGLVDVMENGVSGYMYSPDDAAGFAEGINAIKQSQQLQMNMSHRNVKTVQSFCIDNARAEVQSLLESIGLR